MKRALSAFVAVAFGGAALAGVGKMDSKPLWDLADHGGPTPIDWAHAVEIPNSCLPDSYAFTIEAKYRFDDMSNEAVMNLLDCTVSDTGFGAYCSTIRNVGKSMSIRCNGETYGGSGMWFLKGVEKGVAHWKPNGTELTLTISARKGWLSVYQDGYLQKSYMMQVTPNLAPIRAGGEAYARDKSAYPDMKGVTLLSLRIWNGLEEYWGIGEPKKKATGFAAGKGWQVRVPVEPLTNAPNVFYYGDSISVGYTKPLAELTKGKANLYHWMSCLYTPGAKGVDSRKFAEIGKLAAYDYAVLNNGLHSLGWTPEKVSDEAVLDSYRTLVRTVRRMCKPTARIVYLMTTPRTNRRNAAGVIEGYDPENEVVLRLNRLAAQVMAEEKVTVIDLYAKLKDRFDLANGDGFHLTDPAYRMIAESICAEILPAVKPPAKEPELLCIYYPEQHVHPEWEDCYPLMGHYDEATPATAAKEIDLAADAGIDAFVYDWHWANGKPIQHEALERGFMKAPNRKRMKFAVMWACRDRDLRKLARAPEDFLAAFTYCAKTYFTDARYWRKDGHPFFSLYACQDFVRDMGGAEKAKEVLARAQAIVKAMGLPSVHFNAMVFSADCVRDFLAAGFDSTALSDVNGRPAQVSPMCIPLVVRGRDCTPEKFEVALKAAKEQAMNDPKRPGAVLINAWNEYIEGSWLLPDTRDGYGVLQAVRRVFGRKKWCPLKVKPILDRSEDVPAEVRRSPLFRKSVSMLGDSYVQNHMAPREESWHYRLAEKYQMEYFNYGMAGNCITIHRVGQNDWGTPMRRRYHEAFHADYLILVGGHNDARWLTKHENGRELFREGLSELLDSLKRDYPQSKLVVVTPWDVHEPGFSDVLEVMREVVPAKGIAFFDAAKDSGIDPNSAEFRKKYFQGPNDNAHLNAAGHALMLERMERFLNGLR